MPARLPSGLVRSALQPRRSALRVPRPASSIRLASTHPSLDPKPYKGVKVGHVFSALALLGIGATSYGLYQFYQSFTAYPDSTTHPIRSKLRAAIRSESQGEYDRASSFFANAYDLALDLYSTGQLDGHDDPLIKLSAIAVRWGGMWEAKGDLLKAIEVYDTGFQPIADRVDSATASARSGFTTTPTTTGTTGQVTTGQVQRGAAIALKLGDLWTTVGGPEAESEAERYYTWAVQELMRLSLTDAQKDKVRQEMAAQESLGSAAKDGATATPKDSNAKGDLETPSWVGEVELVAAFERLGDLYSRQGRIELAQPLLQQAIATLYPPPKKDAPPQAPPPIARRCHAATLMNNLSSALVAAPSPSSQLIEASARWARQALHVANSCKREADKARKGVETPLAMRDEKECDLTAVVSTYNLGKLSEMAKDTTSAEQWFIRSGKLASQLGLRDAAQQAQESLRRLKHPTL
ncbi:hypothetical protein JCM10212_002690 [Sporobolomyces blumeae]